MGQHLWDKSQTRWVKQEGDLITAAQTVVDYSHHEIHSGKYFTSWDDTADLGAETGDHLTLQFTTPAASSGLVHAIFSTYAVGATLYTLREGQTGGGESGASVTSYNRRRSSANTGLTVLKDSTLGTAGTVIDSRNYGAGQGAGTLDANHRDSNEWILEAATLYQARVYGTGANAAYIRMDYYIHTDRKSPSGG